MDYNVRFVSNINSFHPISHSVHTYMITLPTAETQDLRSRLESLIADLSSTRTQRDRLQQELSAKDSALSQAESSVAKLTAQVR